MRDIGTVKFSLFGRFKIEVNERPIAIHEVAFFTYLKLLLLSGEPSLSNTETCPLGPDAKAIRDIVDKGNSPPRPNQGGRYDFTAKTGLSLRYREGFGLELQGNEFESDLARFEEVWDRRSKVSDEDLEQALELYGKGVNVKSWARDRILDDCQEWLRARLRQLEERREEIELELGNRRRDAQSKEAATIHSDASRELNDERGSHREISGLQSAEDRFEMAITDSTRLGQDLREEGQQGVLVGNPGFARPKGDRHIANGTPKPQTGSPGESEPIRVVLPLVTPKRSISALGVAVIALLAFLVGYLVGSK